MGSVKSPNFSDCNPCTPKRKKSNLQVVVVEDHNEALYYWYRGIGAKVLPFEGGIVLHFDSHPDLMIPEKLDSTRIHEKSYLLDSLSIENWILPAVYAKHFTSIAWLKPPWATQISEGLHRFQIGHHQATKEIKVTCPESYFVSELAWCPAHALESAHEVHLEVRTLGKNCDEEVAEASSVLSSELLEQLKSKPYVLDIDLDFYSTKNPFLSMFTEEQFDILRELFHYEHPSDNSETALLEATAQRRDQLSELRSTLTPDRAKSCSMSSGETTTTEEEHRDVKKTVAGAVRGRTRREKAEALLATYDGDRDILFDAGCTCDDCDLPNHVTSHDEIQRLIDVTTSFLKILPKPALVTISRSARDDYTPPEDVDFIQSLVLDMLKLVFGDFDLLLDYKNDIVSKSPD